MFIIGTPLECGVAFPKRERFPPMSYGVGGVAAELRAAICLACAWSRSVICVSCADIFEEPEESSSGSKRRRFVEFEEESDLSSEWNSSGSSSSATTSGTRTSSSAARDGESAGETAFFAFFLGRLLDLTFLSVGSREERPDFDLSFVIGGLRAGEAGSAESSGAVRTIGVVVSAEVSAELDFLVVPFGIALTSS